MQKKRINELLIEISVFEHSNVEKIRRGGTIRKRSDVRDGSDSNSP